MSEIRGINAERWGDYAVTKTDGAKYVRTYVNTPVGYRMAVFPGGRRQLQVAYAWYEDEATGIEWRTQPDVYVDAQGKEIDSAG